MVCSCGDAAATVSGCQLKGAVANTWGPGLGGKVSSSDGALAGLYLPAKNTDNNE